MSRRPAFVLLAATLAIATTLAGAPGQAAPSTARPTALEGKEYLSDETRARMAAQKPLKEAASRLQQVVEAGGSTGYAGIVLDEGYVGLWWKGDLPAAIQTALSDARRHARVVVKEAAQSRAELEAAAEGVGAYLKGHPESPYHQVDIAYDGSGLTVSAKPAGGRLARAGLPERMRVPAEIPVRVVEREPAQLTASRHSDIAPFWAGGRIRNNDTDEQCSSGWSVVSNNSGWQYMLTAAHCGRINTTWRTGSWSTVVGTANHEHQDHDLMLISARVGGRMWDGGVGSNEFSKRVVGWNDTWPGEWLCTSGSTSGAFCNHRVSSDFTYQRCGPDPYGRWFCWKDLVLADQMNGWTASRGGDSGGPVFATEGSDRVIAKGIIHGVRNTTQLIFQDYRTIFNDFNVSPLTS